MGFIALALPALLAAAPTVSEYDTFTWCVTEATSPTGKVRFFSDPFEGSDDVAVRGAFQEYVGQAYGSARRTSGYVTTCSTEHGLAAAKAALSRAEAPQRGVTDVRTAWRTGFE